MTCAFVLAFCPYRSSNIGLQKSNTIPTYNIVYKYTCVNYGQGFANKTILGDDKSEI